MKIWTITGILITSIVCFVLSIDTSLDPIREGECWNPEPPQIPFQYNWMFEYITQAKYTPMASAGYYAYVHSLLTGNEPETIVGLDKMCLEVEAGMSLLGRGYAGKHFEMSCAIMSISSLKCARSEDKENGTTLYLTWTENKKYIMFAACTPGNLKAWTVMSSEKTVDDPTKIKILEHIESLGFDQKKAMVMDYTECSP